MQTAIKAWIFEFMHAAGTPEEILQPDFTAQTFADCFDVWRAAENFGFEGVFFSEHHLPMSYSPSPNLLVAAAARETKRLRLGVMGVVLPFYPPWRVVEEAFMLDHLSGGRFEFGCALGVPQELGKVGISAAEARERYEEALEIIGIARREPVFSFSGKYWSFEKLSILPRARQQPGPSFWLPVLSNGSAEKAARMRVKISTGFESVQRVADLFDVYRAEADRQGFQVSPYHLALRRNISIGASAAEAQEAVDVSRGVSKQLMAGDTRMENAGPVNLDEPKMGSGFSVSPDEYIVGTPSQVAEQIIEQCRATGTGHFLMTIGRGLGPKRKAAVDLFGREVLPHLSKASIAG
ncbi:MAG: LLM class flavin-dependent oxidoreductase [Hyphomicrobiales bacterium]|nr:LLM class flavin-dependent oxidoreductase [Hyphomicrobiales bacterium]